MKTFIVAILTACVFCVALGVSAQEPQEVYALSLDEASRLALDNSYDVQLLKYDAWLARTQKGVAESIYDTLLSADATYRKDQSLKTSTIFGTKTQDNDYNFGLTKKLPTGTTLDVDWTNNRNSNNSSFASSAVTHDSALGVSLTQSLGRDLFGHNTRGQIKITYQEILSSEYTSLERMEQFLVSVQKAYWDLAVHQAKSRIAEDMLVQAKMLHDSHSEKYNVGLIERAEYLASEANYKQRMNEAKIMQNLVKSKANILRLMLNIADDEIVIQAADPLMLGDSIPEEMDALRSALDHRWDFKSLQAKAKANAIHVSVEKNSLWPQIDLKASFKRNGLGDDFSDSINDIVQEDNPDLSLGVAVSFPLENSKASAQFKQAKLDKARNLIDLKRLERVIVLGVLDQRRDAKLFWEVAQSQENIAQLQEQKYQEESKRFKSGRSSTDQIIRFQEDVLVAQQKAVEAKENLMLALIELNKRQGTLLVKYFPDDVLQENSNEDR